METLKISKEYKFKKGGSEFYISERQKLKIKLSSGDIFEGTLLNASELCQVFDILTDDDEITIECDNVVDIMPI